MSKNKRKVTTSMENTTQTQADQPVDQTTEQTEQNPTAEQADVVQESEVVQAQEAQVEQTEPQNQAPVEIKLGSVVDGASAPLGQTATEEKVKEIVSQPSKAVDPTVSKFDQKINAIFAKGDSTQQMIINNLRGYVDVMAPGKPMTPEQGKVHQKILWNTIFKVVNTEENFNENFKILVMFFRNYGSGVLGDLYPFRFIEEMKNLSNTEQRAFMQMLNLLIVTAGFTSNKEVKKHVSVERSVAIHFSQEVQQRVINYYAN